MRGIGPTLTALLLTACGGSPPTVRYNEAPYGDRGDRTGRSVPTDVYAADLDDPERDEWQQPERILEVLGIDQGMRIADVGTGSGYFLPHLDRAVGPAGVVVGEDIDEELLAVARARVEREGLSRVELRRGEPDDPHLEAQQYDIVLVVNTYHHVADPIRVAFFERIARALRPRSGRLVVVDYRDGDLPVGPRPGHKIPRAQVERELQDAGYRIVREHDFLPYQYLLELTPAG